MDTLDKNIITEPGTREETAMVLTTERTETEIVVGVIVQGYLTIPVQRSEDGHGNDVSGRYATYRVTSPEQLVDIANQYCWVERGGKRMRGSAYTLRMAKNDFSTRIVYPVV